MPKSECCDEIKSFLDLFKSELFNNLLESRKLDEDRNIKLDEMILRLEGFGVDGKITGPGTRSFKERSKSLSKRLKGSGGKLYDKAKSLSGKWLTFNKDVIKSTYGVAKQSVLGVKDAIFNKVQNVYVAGDLKNPKLKADLLRAGEYRDKITGKVIKSIDDIKGEVVNSKNETVLFLSDIQQGLVNEKGEKIRGFISRFFGASFEHDALRHIHDCCNTCTTLLHTHTYTKTHLCSNQSINFFIGKRSHTQAVLQSAYKFLLLKAPITIRIVTVHAFYDAPSPW
jgi:hypothetical protein